MTVIAVSSPGGAVAETVRVAVPTIPPVPLVPSPEAVMVAVPGPTAVTRSVPLTLATPGALDAQVVLVVILAVDGLPV